MVTRVSIVGLLFFAITLIPAISFAQTPAPLVGFNTPFTLEIRQNSGVNVGDTLKDSVEVELGQIDTSQNIATILIVPQITGVGAYTMLPTENLTLTLDRPVDGYTLTALTDTTATIVATGSSAFGASQTSNTSNAASCPSITRPIFLGSRGTDVTQLQQFLVSEYENFPTPTGYFGPLTQAAVQEWQSSHGIVSSGTSASTGYGVVGPRTAAAMHLCTSASASSTSTATPTSKQTLIQHLIAQLEALEAQLGALQAEASSSPSVITPTPSRAIPPVASNGGANTSSQTTGSSVAVTISTLPPVVTNVATTSNPSQTSTSTSATQSQTYPTLPNPTQTLAVGGYDIYSPDPVIVNGSPRLYFGGWLSSSDLPHDAIFAADCGYGGACTNPRKVIDAVASGLYQVNDPSIVLMPPSGSDPSFYIMYMTGDTDTTIASNGIYYSTSWATDGITWSKPALLMTGYWLPSATVKNGDVQLYANSTTDGRVVQFDLGTSGTQVGTPTYVSFDNAASVPPYYSNVDVEWRPSLNLYQILAERELSASAGASSVIDYLTSTDGISWHLQYPTIISAQSGQYRVATPAQWPDSASWLYFGSTAQQDSTGFHINFAQWNPPESS